MWVNPEKICLIALFFHTFVENYSNKSASMVRKVCKQAYFISLLVFFLPLLNTTFSSLNAQNVAVAAQEKSGYMTC